MAPTMPPTVPPAAFTPDLKRLIWLRDGGHCCRCGEAVWQGDIHHRRPRQQGGGNARWEWINHSSNLVLLCRTDHDWLEAEPEEARAAGYRLDVAEHPEDVMVYTWEGLWFRLWGGPGDGDGMFRDPLTGLLAPYRGAPAPRWSGLAGS